jgi:protein-tyrosine phosphatase
VSVESAGLLFPGEWSPREVDAVLLRRELALPDHRSRRLEPVLESPPDIIVAMAREHARAVVDLRPDLFARTFTVKEFVRHAAHENRRRPDERLDAYLARIQQGRRPWGLAGRHLDDRRCRPYRPPPARVRALRRRARGARGGGGRPRLARRRPRGPGPRA